MKKIHLILLLGLSGLLLSAEVVEISLLVPDGYKLNAGAPQEIAFDVQERSPSSPSTSTSHGVLAYAYSEDGPWLEQKLNDGRAAINVGSSFGGRRGTLSLWVEAGENISLISLRMVLCDADDELLCYMVETQMEHPQPGSNGEGITLNIPEPGF